MTATAQRRSPPDRTAAEVNAHFESLRTDAVDRLEKLLLALADGMPLADADVDVDDLLGKAKLTRDWFTQTLTGMKVRPKLAAKTQRLSALKERKATNAKALTELQSKCDLAVEQAVSAAMQPFEETLSSLEAQDASTGNGKCRGAIDPSRATNGSCRDGGRA